MCDTLKCNTCNAPKEIKESVGCNADRLFNSREVFKSEFLKRMKINYEPQFQCRFADLIKSIEEDDTGDVMAFPATFEEFAEQYKIVDKQEVYTNGTELIPIFRVQQWLNNAGVASKSEAIDEFAERLKERLFTIPTVYNAHFGRMIDAIAKEMKGE
jgi:hypothetical protein